MTNQQLESQEFSYLEQVSFYLSSLISFGQHHLLGQAELQCHHRLKALFLHH